jgi:hypothetical protein
LNSLLNLFARTLKDSLENAGEEMNRLHALVAKQESSLETLLKEAESRSEELEELRTSMSKVQVKRETHLLATREIKVQMQLKQ